MRQEPGIHKSHGEKVVNEICRATRKQYSAEEKIRIVLDGLMLLQNTNDLFFAETANLHRLSPQLANRLTLNARLFRGAGQTPLKQKEKRPSSGLQLRFANFK